MYAKDDYGGYSAFVAYKKSLLAAIQFYGTHEREEMRSYLPLSDDERMARLDPVAIMEAENLRGKSRDPQINGQFYPAAWRLETDRAMVTAYHEFYLAFVAIGNIREAAGCRREKMDRLRKVYLAEKRYKAAALYTLWKITAGYGESLSRWAVTCMAVLLGFAATYAVFNLIQPVINWFDYIYFSIVTFTSLGYGDVHPVGVAGKLVASAEILCGLVLFGLLLSFIANRAQRIGPGA